MEVEAVREVFQHSSAAVLNAARALPPEDRYQLSNQLIRGLLRAASGLEEVASQDDEGEVTPAVPAVAAAKRRGRPPKGE
jgi:hypothetical protein